MDASETVDFLDVRVEEVTATRAVVRFDTSVETTCEAEFGLASDMLLRTAVDPDMEEGQFTTRHRVPLEDLLPNRTYFWRAKTNTPSGRIFYSEVFSFETPEAPEQPSRINVALLTGAATVLGVSSNYDGASNTSSWGVNRAFDGQMATEWATDGDGNDAWLEVDLGAQYSLAAFGFRSREMSDGSSIIRSVRLLFDDGATIAGPFETPDPKQHYVFEFEPPIVAKTVRVEAVDTSGGNTGAREVELLVEQP